MSTQIAPDMLAYICRAAISSIAALAIAAAATSSGPARADDFDWVGTWGESPQAGFPTTFSNQTIRQIARISVGGNQFRIRLSNELGNQPIQIGDAHIAISAGGGAIKAGTDRVLTFGGFPTTTIPADAAVISDPVNLEAPNLTSVAVSIYLIQSPGLATWHQFAIQTGYIATGDLTASTDLTAVSTTTQSRYFLTGIEVASVEPKTEVVTLGDSITDGYQSTLDADHRWPDRLADRLATHGNDHTGVVNEGISGNRLLQDAAGAGQGGLARFDRDVLATPGVRFVTVLLGINDLGTDPSGVIAVTDFIAAYRQIIARAHSRGVLAYGGTITPASGLPGSPFEARRQAINTWIRTSGEWDGVIDFDAAVRDPANPTQLFPAFNSGDFVHPNDAGYQAMANAIDLNLFLVGVGED